ncbi:MAG: hypothetical protein U1D36_13535, partial [Hydrogenophaga sp.]|uniref:hypothetical protein n=1 Tax=Hydrogenophaga sp. TaxID=1904254 RepID=UPI002ABBE0C3
SPQRVQGAWQLCRPRAARPSTGAGGTQSLFTLFSTHSLRVAAKNAMRGNAKPCRGATTAAFRAVRKAFLIRNASWKNSVNRT